jgi:hypothetical protein
MWNGHVKNSNDFSFIFSRLSTILERRLTPSLERPLLLPAIPDNSQAHPKQVSGAGDGRQPRTTSVTHISNPSMVDARFRKLFLQHIEDVVTNQEPSRESLMKLLQQGKPDFSDEDASNESARGSAFRVLKGLIHPDKHPGDCAQTVTSLFQDVQTFYDRCCIVMIAHHHGGSNCNVARRRSPTSVNYPLQFHVKDQWPFLEVVEPKISLFFADINHGLIARLIAYKCINSRGTIAHGKKAELFYSTEQVTGFEACDSVKDAFFDVGGSKVLTDIDSIKEELMTSGPVVSTSFILARSFLNACEHSSSFDASLIDQVHPIVVVGWKLDICMGC